MGETGEPGEPGEAGEPDEVESARAQQPRSARGRLRRAAIVVLSALATSILFVVLTNVMVMRSTPGLVFDDPQAVPERRVAIVFGTLVNPDGTPSMKLGDRVAAAVDLFHAGRVTHLLMSGDKEQGTAYDEVGAMRDAAIAAGVPPEAITRDPYGFETYDTCARARSVYGVTDAVVVTQDYHIGRALYLCREQGIDAVGLAVPDWQHRPERLTGEYSRGQQVSFMLREYLARTKAVVAAKITHPEPAVGGALEGLHPS